MGAAGVRGRDIGHMTWPTAGRLRCHTDRMPRRAATDGGGTDPPATLRSQHVEATRHAVLAAARSLFGQKGYAQTSVDEIAAAARVTKGAVYHHFASKVALFRAVYAEVEAEAQARTAEAVDPNGSPIDQIVAGVNAYLDVALKKAATLSRALPRLARVLVRLQARSPAARRRGIATVTTRGLDPERTESFFGPVRRDRRVADDLVAATAGFRPQLLIDAAEAIPRFDRPVLLIWGESCGFFPMAHARRLASDFPRATLVCVPGAKTWVPIDDPAAVSGAIAQFVPVPVP